MLASPLMPASKPFTLSAEDSSLQCRPAQDREAFNRLLPPPIEFVEGSSSGALAIPQGKYQPINAPLKSPGTDPKSPSTKNPVAPPAGKGTAATSRPSLYPHTIGMTWPIGLNRGSGLHNAGNTCFLNSTLQCLLHTPPVLYILNTHSKETCRVPSGFCMSCSMRTVMDLSYRDGGRTTFAPTAITTRLQVIAKHMRKGRQEDSHEFLRYAIDALQKSCLAGHSPKIDPKLAETTWVHKIFGGRLRSRVTCRSCGHNSDTFDRILDLSVDINRAESLREALGNFVAIDYLKGADKYKCEKCKQHVIAEKQFTVHDAPLVLTVHLKRFTPTGKKIAHHVLYDEELSLQPYMSDNQSGPTYCLYGVICHIGGGPNSGHYYAFVKSKDGQWWEMNDELVTKSNGPPLDRKSAYMLFYIRKKGQVLEAAVNGIVQRPRPTLIGGMKKRKDSGSERSSREEEDTGTKVSMPFIGPQLPSPSPRAKDPETKGPSVGTAKADPQARLLKQKIEAAEALKGLDVYNSDSEPDRFEVHQKDDPESPPTITSSLPETFSPDHLTFKSSSPVESSPVESSPIPPNRFYAQLCPKKRKILHDGPDVHCQSLMQAQSRGYKSTSKLNPYRTGRYGQKKLRAL